MAGKPIFVKPIPFTVVSVSTEMAAQPGAHLGEFQFPAMTWRTSATTGTHYLVIDFGVPTTVDHVALLATNAISAATFEVTMATTLAKTLDGTAEYQGGYNPVISPSVSGRNYYHSFTDIASPAYRYLAVRIIGHTGAFEAAKLIVGQKIASAKYYETSWSAGPLDLSNVTDNRNGIPDIAYGLVQRQLSFTLGWMSENEWEISISPLLQACGKTEPVYCCFDPDATIYRQNRTYFGRLSESRMEKQGFNRFQKQFDIRSFF